MRTSKNDKIFPANNKQGSMKRGEKWFREKHLNKEFGKTKSQLLFLALVLLFITLNIKIQF